MPLPRKRSPDGDSTDWGGGHLITAYYSFINVLALCHATNVYAPSWRTCYSTYFIFLFSCVSMFEFIFVPHVIFVRLFIPFFRYFSVLIQSTSRSQFFFVVYFYGSHPPYLHLATSEMWFWSGGRGILRKLSLLYSTVCYYNGAQRYEQFLYKSVDCIGLWSCLVWLSIIWAPLYLRSSWC